MADESGLRTNRRYIVRDTEKAPLNKLQTTTTTTASVTIKVFDLNHFLETNLRQA
jgi:hypothetical protein